MNENGKKVKARHIKISFIVLTFLFFLTLAGFAWVLTDLSNQANTAKNLAKENARLARKTAVLSIKTAHLSKENSKRISEIQESRVESCKTTYRSYPKVFKPFLPKKPKTLEEKVRFKIFSTQVNKLVRGCEKQTHPKTKKVGS